MVAALRGSASTLRAAGGVADRQLFFSQQRPQEGGRQAVVGVLGAGAAPRDVVPDEMSVRSSVHEYGGAAFCPLPAEGPGTPARSIVVVEAGEQRLWRIDLDGGEPRALSAPGPEKVAYGDLWPTPDGRFVLAVAERRSNAGSARRQLVAVPTEPSGAEVVLFEGPDFLAAPRPGPPAEGGWWLAFVSWDHPAMPWDASTLWVGRLLSGDGARLTECRRLAGGPRSSVGQPTWCGEEGLVFVWDRFGWWQPWRWRPGGPCRRLSAVAAEFEAPQWSLGQGALAYLGESSLGCRLRQSGRDHVGVVDLATGSVELVDQPCVSINSLAGGPFGLAWLGATEEEPPGLYEARGVPPKAPVRLAGPRRPAPLTARPEAFEAPGPAGVVPGFVHRPWSASLKEPPPLVVHCHGGPTGSAEAGFDPVVQFFASRGFAVAQVDYRGSSGHGRRWRRALLGAWGEADAEDCLAAARFLCDEGLADRRRLVVRGSSAGGLTALNALASGRLFAGAASWYGVTDLAALAATTHDFEAHYTEALVGPWPTAAATYRSRSPVNRVAEMTGAVLLLHGSQDPVVPLSQAEALAEALAAAGHEVELVTFEGEGHGFRRAEVIERALETEVAFYRRLLGPGSARA